MTLYVSAEMDMPDNEELLLRLILFFFRLRHVFILFLFFVWLFYKISGLIPHVKKDLNSGRDSLEDDGHEDEEHSFERKDAHWNTEIFHDEGLKSLGASPDLKREKSPGDGPVDPPCTLPENLLRRKRSQTSPTIYPDPTPDPEPKRPHSMRETTRKASTSSNVGDVNPGLYAGKVYCNIVLDCHGFQIGNSNSYADITRTISSDLRDGFDRSADGLDGGSPGGSEEALADANPDVHFRINQVLQNIDRGFNVKRSHEDLVAAQAEDQPLQRSCSEDILDRMPSHEATWESTEELQSQDPVTGSGGLLGGATNTISHLYRRQISASLANVLMEGQNGRTNWTRNLWKTPKQSSSSNSEGAFYAGQFTTDDSDSSPAGSSEDVQPHGPETVPEDIVDHETDGPNTLSTNVYQDNCLVSSDGEDNGEPDIPERKFKVTKPKFVQTKLKIFGLSREHREYMEKNEKKGFKLNLRKILRGRIICQSR